MGPRASLDRYGKSRPPPGFDPRTVQPVASRYTDYATRPTANAVSWIYAYPYMYIARKKHNITFKKRVRKVIIEQN